MKLYVGNLAYSVNDNTLRDLFEPFGNVESARDISDRDTGSSKGFGFVETADADAQKAMRALNGREVDGRALRANRVERGVLQGTSLRDLLRSPAGADVVPVRLPAD